MFSITKMTKVSLAVLTAGIICTATGYATDNAQEDSVFVELLKGDSTISATEDMDVKVISLDMDELNSEKVFEQLNHLPEDTQEKVKKLLKEGEFSKNAKTIVVADGVTQLFTEEDGAEKVVFIKKDQELEIVLPDDADFAMDDSQDSVAKVITISSTGELQADIKYKMLTSLLKNATLEPEQLNALQKLLDEKY